MAGLKVFLALCCVAAASAVQLERKPFKRLIPADVLRGESIQFILEYQTNVRRCRFDVLRGGLDVFLLASWETAILGLTEAVFLVLDGVRCCNILDKAGRRGFFVCVIWSMLLVVCFCI